MKKKVLIVMAIILVVCLSVTTLVGCAGNEKMKKGDLVKTDTLALPSNGKIKVLQLTDLHLTKGRSYSYDAQTLKWVEEAIDKAKPDIVAMTGDTVGSIYGRDQAMIQLANMLERKKVYWMYTFGNHDGEWSMKTKKDVGKTDGEEGRQELYNILRGYEYSLMNEADGAADGIGNYVVKWKNAADKIVHAMVNMDTHGKKYENGADKGYIGLKESQVKWYNDSMDSLIVEGTYPSSSLYMHVPLIQYQEVWEDKDNGHIRDFPAIELEGMCYAPKTDIGMFDAMKVKGTNFVTAGHDHMFSWMRELDGVYLTYGRTSGVNAWGRYVPIGATVIEIDPTATTTRDMYSLSVIEPSFEYNPWSGQYLKK